MTFGKKCSILLFATFSIGCSANQDRQDLNSDDLEIEAIDEGVWLHRSFLEIPDYGPFPCNGMIVSEGKECIVFDTPCDDEVSRDLINLIENKLRKTITAVVPTHFHIDCLGGLEAFHKKGIPSIALMKTVQLAEENHMPVPMHAFSKSKVFELEDRKIVCSFPGEGHTRDNIIVHVPELNLLFGGCLVKAKGASRGNVNDANLEAWPETIEKLQEVYPELKTVIPGHGEVGDSGLLEYTRTLFAKETEK